MDVMTENKVFPKLRFREFEDKWVACKVDDVFNVNDGTHQTPKYVNEGIPFVSVESINDLYSKGKFITKDAFEKDFKIKPKKNDIFMTRITAGIIGNTAIVKDDKPLAYYVSLALLRNKTKNDINFLEQRINTSIFKRELHKRIIHVAFPKKINLSDINKCNFSFPSLLEQQKIASFLSAVDEKLQQLTKKKDLLEEYKKGVMQKIFSQELRFKDANGNNYPHWEENKLGEIAFKTSSNISANKIEENFGEYVIYGASGVLKKVDFYREENPYISIVKDGAGVGRVLMCEPYSSVLGTLDIIKPKENNDLYFIYTLLQRIYFERYTVGSTIPHIYFKDYSLEKIKVPLFEEQQKIANFLSAIDTKIDLVSTQIENTKVFKKGLLQQMFV